jgi:hypothetical protein
MWLVLFYSQAIGETRRQQFEEEEEEVSNGDGDALHSSRLW